VSLNQLKGERPGSGHESLEAYYRSLGGPLPDEPCLVVRISKDGDTHFLKEHGHDVKSHDERGEKVGEVTVSELPEDQFWFFRVFVQLCSTSPKLCPVMCMKLASLTLMRFSRGISPR